MKGRNHFALRFFWTHVQGWGKDEGEGKPEVVCAHRGITDTIPYAVSECQSTKCTLQR